jgi:cytochrome d ubiquinol oxidase subunit II
MFSFASILLAIFFGAALGNVVRGVPLNAEGYFFEPLWTTFTVVPESGILDWFTVLMGLVAFFVLASHGANYIAYKTEGEIQSRSRVIAAVSWWGVLFFSIATMGAVTSIRPELWSNYAGQPWGYLFPAAGLMGLIGMFYYNRTQKDLRAFASSATFIAGMLASTAFGLYPNVLPSSTDPAHSLTIFNTKAQDYGLEVGLIWWIIGLVFVTAYFVYVYKMFAGKVHIAADDSGY